MSVEQVMGSSVLIKILKRVETKKSPKLQLRNLGDFNLSFKVKNL